MRSIMMASVAILSLAGAAGVATAQDMPAQTMQPPGTEAPASPDNVSPPADQGMATNPSADAPPPPAPDVNGGQPTGAVPSSPGMVPAPADAPRDPAAPVGSSSNPVTMGGNMTPPPAEAKDYPVCSRTVTDSCINPGEAKGKKRRR